ncbi:hypothetical protein RUND412_004573 [Rhizina undulata]
MPEKYYIPSLPEQAMRSIYGPKYTPRPPPFQALSHLIPTEIRPHPWLDTWRRLNYPPPNPPPLTPPVNQLWGRRVHYRLPPLPRQQNMTPPRNTQEDPPTLFPLPHQAGSTSQLFVFRRGVFESPISPIHQREINVAEELVETLQNLEISEPPSPGHWPGMAPKRTPRFRGMDKYLHSVNVLRGGEGERNITRIRKREQVGNIFLQTPKVNRGAQAVEVQMKIVGMNVEAGGLSVMDLPEAAEEWTWRGNGSWQQILVKKAGDDILSSRR